MGAAAWIALAQLANNLLELLMKQKQAAEQTGAWTPEERALVGQESARLASSHAWLTDSEGGR